MRPKTAIAAAATALCLVGIPAAANAGDDEVIREGGCSGSASWKLKAKTDDRRLEVEGEVDANRVGQTWKWRILHNGNVAHRGTSTTAGRSGSFSVERRVGNAPGVDKIGWRAVNTRSGQTCKGSLRF